MRLNHKVFAMVACHLNFQFQVFTLLKWTKELGLAHFIVDVPPIHVLKIHKNNKEMTCSKHNKKDLTIDYSRQNV